VRSEVGAIGVSKPALERLLDEPLDGTTKGLPYGARVTLRSIADQGWNLFSGELPLPIVVLDPDAVRHNIELVQRFADAHDTWLAPHGKTTMAPQIWAQQLAAGAWGITVATAAQLQVASSFGISRIILANEPVTEYEYRLLASEIRAGREVWALVDSIQRWRPLSRSR
jgi:D-serine dehydratase